MFVNERAARLIASLDSSKAGDHWIEALKDGTPVLIRPLRAADRELEYQFLQHLSPLALRFRFLGAVSHVNAALIEELVSLDYHDRMAYVALVHVDGRLQEIGGSSYARVAPDDTCQCSIAVADGWQHRGLGSLLLTHLIDAARRNGFQKMSSTQLATDYAVNGLFKKLGFSVYCPTVDGVRTAYERAL
ncbi:MAG TPA: GNAT family N-acetyltransferase [Pseudomonas sp.]|jgi:GNAT superfamily N-acetyltransferase